MTGDRLVTQEQAHSFNNKPSHVCRPCFWHGPASWGYSLCTWGEGPWTELNKSQKVTSINTRPLSSLAEGIFRGLIPYLLIWMWSYSKASFCSLHSFSCYQCIIACQVLFWVSLHRHRGRLLSFWESRCVFLFFAGIALNCGHPRNGFSFFLTFKEKPDIICWTLLPLTWQFSFERSRCYSHCFS